jgi:hypothetical protein
MRIAVDTLCDAFAAGSVAEDLAPVLEPVRIGLGQSLGGHLVVVCEGQHAVFDGIALLGVSRHHTKMSSAPGTVLAEPSYLPRGTNIGGLASETYIRAAPEVASNGRGWPFCAWCLHYDDEPHEIIEVDMLGYPARQHTPVWASDSIPTCVLSMMSPGAIAPEAASVTVRVFIGVGERDTVPKLRTEPTAYPRSPDITTFECPKMAHMHNFASTRERMWTRVQ